VPIRTARLTRAGPQPCAAARASGAGLEPARTRVRALLGTPTPHPEPIRDSHVEIQEAARLRTDMRLRYLAFITLTNLAFGTDQFVHDGNVSPTRDGCHEGPHGVMKPHMCGCSTKDCVDVIRPISKRIAWILSALNNIAITATVAVDQTTKQSAWTLVYEKLLPVRRQGLEPRFAGLRVQCCTCIARGAWSGMQESNPHSRFGGPAH
jgi:hypothetical protein